MDLGYQLFLFFFSEINEQERPTNLFRFLTGKYYLLPLSLGKGGGRGIQVPLFSHSLPCNYYLGSLSLFLFHLIRYFPFTEEGTGRNIQQVIQMSFSPMRNMHDMTFVSQPKRKKKVGTCKFLPFSINMIFFLYRERRNSSVPRISPFSSSYPSKFNQFLSHEKSTQIVPISRIWCFPHPEGKEERIRGLPLPALSLEIPVSSEARWSRSPAAPSSSQQAARLEGRRHRRAAGTIRVSFYHYEHSKSVMIPAEVIFTTRAALNCAFN